MMKFLAQTAGVLFWVASLVLTASIVWAYVGSQGAIPAGIATLAVVGAAVGMVIAEKRWRQGARFVAVVSFFGFVFGEAFLIPIEIGYWANQVQQREKQLEIDDIRRASEIAAMKSGVARSFGDSIRTSEEVQSDIVAELARPVTYVNVNKVGRQRAWASGRTHQ
jgi:hypothetical protein